MSSQGIRVLLVEDDDGVRESLSLILDGEGYAVTSASSAERALELFGDGPYHLVVTDYALPARSGAWLLEEARRRGRLDGATAVMITALRDVKAPEGCHLFRKPLDLDAFLVRLREVLAPVRESEVARTQRVLEERLSSVGRKGAGVKIELILYISDSSPSSLKALRRLENLLGDYDLADVSFTVCNLSRGPSRQADEDRIAFTPTLVKRYPLPRTWIVGHLGDAQVIADLLSDAGVALRSPTSGGATP